MTDYASKMLWLFFAIAVMFLIPVFLSKQLFLFISYFITIMLIFLLLIQLEKQRRLQRDISSILKELSLKSLKEELKTFRLNETKKLINGFDAVSKLEEYKNEQEKRQREFSRKILDLENKVDEKFDLLGKAILKVGKEKSKSNT